MIDSPRFQTIKRQARFNSADFLQAFTRKPVASLRTGADLITVLLMEAVGHDIFTSRSGDHAINGFLRWVIGQNGTFLAGCELIDCLGYEISGVHISQC